MDAMSNAPRRKRKMFDHMKARYQIVLPEAAPATPGGAVAHAAAASR